MLIDSTYQYPLLIQLGVWFNNFIFITTGVVEGGTFIIVMNRKGVRLEAIQLYDLLILLVVISG